MDDAHKAEPEQTPYVRVPWALVAAALAGILVVALAAGLFANRYLRPQLEAAPTPVPMPIAQPIASIPAATPVISAATSTATSISISAAATLAPATREPTQAPSTQNIVATPRPTISPVLAAEIGDAYQQYWQLRAEALYSLDSSRLQEVMSGEHLAAAEELIAQLQSEGRAIQTDVNHNYVIVQATSNQAEIADDYTDNSTYVDVNSHQALTQPVSEEVKEQYQLNKIDGTWRIVSLVRANS